jgi:hypothetical protein
VWVFQAGSTLKTAWSRRVNLINGASACNVFWQVGSSATLGTGSTFRGSILALTSITVTTGVTIHGRVLARNGAVTLDTDTITRPTCKATPPTSSASPTAPSTGPSTGRTGGPTPGPTTPGQVTKTPSGPPQTGDGGSVHESHPILATTGGLALLASIAALVLWRREVTRA